MTYNYFTTQIYNNKTDNKLQQIRIYLLTPQGIAAKTRLTKKFLKIKQQEYNQLKELLK